MKDFIEIVSEFLKRIGERYKIEWLVNDITLILLGLGVLFLVLKYTWWAIRWSALKYGKHQFKKITPYFTSAEINEALRLYITTKFQDIDPAELEEPYHNQFSRQRSNLIEKFNSEIFLDKYQNEKFFIILGDTGLGKTTFLINLFIKYKLKFTLFNVIPHKYKIRLYPLNSGQFDSYVNTIDDEEKNETILLIDAFDEDFKANKNVTTRLSEIIELSKNFRFILITSRSQFFNSEEDIPLYTDIKKSGGQKGVYQLVKFYISPLSKKEINKYIEKRFGLLKFGKRRKAKKILLSSPYLLARPMLLNQIEDLLDINKSNLNQLDVYRHLVDKWLSREANNCGEEFEICKTNLFNTILEIAKFIYEYPQSNIYKYSIHNNDIKAIASKHSVDIDNLSLTPKSILNRNADNFYKFSHKSIYEFLLENWTSKSYEFFRSFDWESHSFTRDIFKLRALEVISSTNFKNINTRNESEIKKFISEVLRISVCSDEEKLKALQICIGTNQLSTVASCELFNKVERQINSIEINKTEPEYNQRGVEIDRVTLEKIKKEADKEKYVELQMTILEISKFNHFVNEHENILYPNGNKGKIGKDGNWVGL